MGVGVCALRKFWLFSFFLQVSGQPVTKPKSRQLIGGKLGLQENLTNESPHMQNQQSV